ncbi:MAG: DUF882 domain-containing protein [Bacteroidota bacterium]
MVSLIALLTVCNPLPVFDETPAGLDQVFDPIAARDLHATPGEPRSLSKREEWMLDKQLRPDVHVSDAALAAARKAAQAEERAPAARRRRRADPTPVALTASLPGTRIQPITTLFNVWTREALPVLPGDPLESRIHSFLRDHYTNQATTMDTRLINVLTRAARKFSAARIEVVSGYRSPKYNLMLRKKGHQVARSSQHVEGHAVDFRIRGVPTRSLLHFVRSLRLGGVGFYPHSQFVHSDTGRIRYWKGS